MKGFILLIFLFRTIDVGGQEIFVKQLQQLITDSANGFKKYRFESEQTQPLDSFFKTTFIIEGTSNNYIHISRSDSFYFTDAYNAIILDSLKENKAKKIAAKWKDMLLTILGNSFQLKKKEIVKWNPSIYGWHFERGNLWIDITLFPKDKSNLCWLTLSITYFHQDYLTNHLGK
jgi:hypothetical protein